MVRMIQFHGTGVGLESAPLAIGLFVSVSALVALCAKHARRGIAKNFGSNDIETSSESRFAPRTPLAISKQLLKDMSESRFAPRSPLATSKQLLKDISNKAIPFIYRKKDGENDDHEEGLWQKSILMGEKCQPPEFSGVIYYDLDGRRLPEAPPRSPRATPLRSFTFPVAREGSF